MTIDTKTSSRRQWMVAAVALQIALMLGTAVPAAVTLTRGKVITLETKPVDPYDMFRGDYVRLAYDIDDVGLPPQTADGSDVYVTLQPKGQFKNPTSGQHWTASSASTRKSNLAPGEMCIKGKYEKDRCRVRYGIEQVFVPEKTGHSAESAKSLAVDVAIDDGGNAVIRRVQNGTQTIYDAKKVILGR